ncbi:hypothetical protein QQ045_033110 [Rhodiola kirilowii]
MGSDYQFPQSLSLSNFSKVREPSFSSYLNDVDGRLVVKLAELTRTGSGHLSPDDEIGVFRADKYFNEGLEDGQKPKESSGFRRFAVEGNKEDSVARSNISLGTPSIRSESSSWHSQTALLHSFPSQVPGRRSTGEMQRKKSFLSGFTSRCSCISKKSLKVDDDHLISKECTRQRINRADQLLQVRTTSPRTSQMKDSQMLYPSVTPSLLELDKAMGSSTHSSQSLLKGNTECSRYNTDSFNAPATGKVRKSISLDRKINLLKNPRSEDVRIASTISVEYYTDAESDASSDLFEIDSFTGHRKSSFSGQIPDSSASGYATPTTCYAPSEASIDWSVATASAADFSLQSDCEEFKPPMPAPITRTNKYTVTDKHKQTTENAGHSLMDSTNHKGVRVSGNMNLQKTKDNINYHQKVHMDQFGPVSRIHAQASNRPPKSSKSHDN